MTGTSKLGSLQKRLFMFSIWVQTGLGLLQRLVKFHEQGRATPAPRPLLSLLCAHTCRQPPPPAAPSSIGPEGSKERSLPPGLCQGNSAKALCFYFLTFILKNSKHLAKEASRNSPPSVNNFQSVADLASALPRPLSLAQYHFEANPKPHIISFMKLSDHIAKRHELVGIKI